MGAQHSTWLSSGASASMVCQVTRNWGEIVYKPFITMQKMLLMHYVKHHNCKYIELFSSHKHNKCYILEVENTGS